MYSRIGSAAVLFAIVAAGASLAQTRPDFSGDWALVRDKSTQTRGSAVIAIAGLLGEKFTAKQDSRTLALDITALGRQFKVLYNLDGSASRNMSPTSPGQPDREIVSYAAWEGDRLVVRTKTPAELDGKPVDMDTRRVMWIDAEGMLTIERSGTPAVLVPTTRSVYQRKGTSDAAPYEAAGCIVLPPTTVRATPIFMISSAGTL
jgi:hypothetical protein